MSTGPHIIMCTPLSTSLAMGLETSSFSCGLSSTLSLFTGLLLPIDAISITPGLNSTLAVLWSLVASWQDLFLAWYKLYLPFVVATYSVIGPCIVQPRGYCGLFSYTRRNLRGGQHLSIHKELLLMNTIRRTYVLTLPELIHTHLRFQYCVSELRC